MTKTIAAALTLTAALIAMPTWADPMAQSGMSKHDQMMQDCITKAKAKNDGTSEAAMKQSCKDEMIKHDDKSMNKDGMPKDNMAPTPPESH